MTSFNWDITGKVVIELRADADVAAIAGANPTTTTVRVRAGDPAPDDVGAGNDMSPYRAFVLLRQLPWFREHRVPVQRARILARSFGRNRQEASQLAVAVSNAVHFIGPRLHANGLGIYASFTTDGGEQDTDPDTQQPFVDVLIDLTATTQAVA